MFALAKDNLHPSLLEYSKTKFCKTLKLKKVKKGRKTYVIYEYINDAGQKIRRNGIHSTLKKKFYPKFKKPGLSKGNEKQGSSRDLGRDIDDKIFEYIRTGKKYRDWKFIRIIDYIEFNLDHTFQAAQLPIKIKVYNDEKTELAINCVTCIDFITMSEKGELFLWELKTGFPRRYNAKNGYIIPDVNNSYKNHWFLQSYYSSLGLKDTCVDFDIKNTRVINVYNERKKNTKVNLRTIQAHKTPKWLKEISLK